MLTSIEGVYRNGKVELAQSPGEDLDGTPVIVAFLTVNRLDLREHGTDAAQAAEMRVRLAPFAEDWESPEMAIYDDYDAAKAAR